MGGTKEEEKDPGIRVGGAAVDVDNDVDDC